MTKSVFTNDSYWQENLPSAIILLQDREGVQHSYSHMEMVMESVMVATANTKMLNLNPPAPDPLPTTNHASIAYNLIK